MAEIIHVNFQDLRSRFGVSHGIQVYHSVSIADNPTWATVVDGSHIDTWGAGVWAWHPTEHEARWNEKRIPGAKAVKLEVQEDGSFDAPDEAREAIERNFF